MHIERIHFDEVFDAAPGRGDFSFRSAGETHYGVNLQRGTIPRAGATYVVAFGRARDWGSVLGWRDLASGEVMLSYSPLGLLVSRLLDVYLYGLLFFALGFLFGGIGTALVFGALFLAGLAWTAGRDLRRLRQARRALLAAEASTERPGESTPYRPAQCDS